MSEFVKSLSPTLFWDVERDEVDDVKHRRFIISRVLERGSLPDWERMRDHYTLPVIVAEAQQLRSLEPRALAFIACVGRVPENSFRSHRLRATSRKTWVY